jgi:hypothetical protein
MERLHIDTYKFDELIADSKDNAIHYCKRVFVRNKYWYYPYVKMAKDVGLHLCMYSDFSNKRYVIRKSDPDKINEFSVRLSADLMSSKSNFLGYYDAAKTIRLNHGDKFISVVEFLNNWFAYAKKKGWKDGDPFSNKQIAMMKDFSFKLEDDFNEKLFDLYKQMTSREYIIKEIIHNEFDFTVHGNLITNP